MKVKFQVIYPAVTNCFPSIKEQHYTGEVETDVPNWASRYDTNALQCNMCERIFAGCGNSPAPESDGGTWGWFLNLRVRSLCVGDVVVFDPESPDWGNRIWVCASVGWKRLTPEQYFNWCRYPRQFTSDSFGLNKFLRKECNIEPY